MCLVLHKGIDILWRVAFGLDFEGAHTKVFSVVGHPVSVLPVIVFFLFLGYQTATRLRR